MCILVLEHVAPTTQLLLEGVDPIWLLHLKAALQLVQMLDPTPLTWVLPTSGYFPQSNVPPLLLTYPDTQ